MEVEIGDENVPPVNKPLAPSLPVSCELGSPVARSVLHEVSNPLTEFKQHIADWVCIYLSGFIGHK